MEETKNAKNLLLVNVPEDVKEIIEQYKKRKRLECGCRIGNSQAIFNMLRKLRILQKTQSA